MINYVPGMPADAWVSHQQAPRAFHGLARLRRITMAALAAILLSVAACAPTQVIEQSRDLSSSGIVYTQAVEALVDATVDEIIDFDTSSLIKSKRGQSAEVLEQMLTQQNEALLGLVGELERFKGQSKLLRVYFVNLQAMADSPVKADVGGAVSALSGSINDLNGTLKTDFELSGKQQNEIGKLAGLVAQGAQASALNSALKRDAEVIATQLALHEQQLGIIAGILQDRFDAKNELFFNEKVKNPFISSEPSDKLDKTWRSDREHYVKTRFTNAKLATAQLAASELRGIWTDILQGKNDPGSLRILISDVNEFVSSVEKVSQP